MTMKIHWLQVIGAGLAAIPPAGMLANHPLAGEVVQVLRAVAAEILNQALPAGPASGKP
jgi:hypothetical protein